MWCRVILLNCACLRSGQCYCLLAAVSQQANCSFVLGGMQQQNANANVSCVKIHKVRWLA